MGTGTCNAPREAEDGVHCVARECLRVIRISTVELGSARDRTNEFIKFTGGPPGGAMRAVHSPLQTLVYSG